MNTEQIEIVIDSNGKATLHVQGIKGLSCMDITNALIRALGVSTETQLTTEAYDGDDDAAGGIEVIL